MHTTNRSLEGLRGAAALLVVLCHMEYISHWSGFIHNGYLSVDLFFVLSGYVIGCAYASRLTNSREVFRFLIRRFGRLWPLHVVTFTLFYGLHCLHSGLSRQPFLLPTPAELASLLTMSNGLNLFDHSLANDVSWSAGDELYVYVLFAAICITIRARSSAFFAALAIAGFVIALRANDASCLTHGDCNAFTFSFGWARCLTGYFLGTLLARHRDALHFLTSPKWQVVAAIATLAWLQLTAVVPALAFAAPLVFGLLVASLMRDCGPVATLLRKRPMQYLGEISYSLYLCHSVFWTYYLNLVYMAGNNHLAWQMGARVGFLFASFGLAHLLHRYVEIPLRERINATADKLPLLRTQNGTRLTASD